MLALSHMYGRTLCILGSTALGSRLLYSRCFFSPFLSFFRRLTFNWFIFCFLAPCYLARTLSDAGSGALPLVLLLCADAGAFQDDGVFCSTLTESRFNHLDVCRAYPLWRGSILCSFTGGSTRRSRRPCSLVVIRTFVNLLCIRASASALGYNRSKTLTVWYARLRGFETLYSAVRPFGIWD